MTESNFLYHTSCDSCGSRDNVAVYDDGHTYCFGCQHVTRENELTQLQQKETTGFINYDVNEIASRVHNSGHLTINSHNISQFENHIRAVCGLEKLETKKIYNAKMLNLIGEDILEYKNKKFKENEFFYDYLKKEVKAKRKMGHLTTIEK